MQAQYSRPDRSEVKITLGPGETLGLAPDTSPFPGQNTPRPLVTGPAVIYASCGDPFHKALVALGTVTIADPDNPPPPTCLLWQIEAICNQPPQALGFTPPTWANVTSVIASLNNPALTAFFNVGSNPIPATSVTLAAIAARCTPAINQAQLTAIVQAASQLSIS